MRLIAAVILGVASMAATDLAAAPSATFFASIDQVGLDGGGAAGFQQASIDQLQMNNLPPQPTSPDNSTPQVAASDQSTLSQAGATDTATVHQSGFGDDSTILQSGAGKTRVTQSGPDDVSVIAQSGANDQAAIFQTSAGARSIVTQTGWATRRSSASRRVDMTGGVRAGRRQPVPDASPARQHHDASGAAVEDIVHQA